MLVDEGDSSMEEKIVVVLNEMSEHLSITQMTLILKAGSVLSMVNQNNVKTANRKYMS